MHQLHTLSIVGSSPTSTTIKYCMFYHQTDFNFSTTAREWILDRYQKKFKERFVHDLDSEQYKNRLIWRAGPVGKELLPFLSKFNCDDSYHGITAFISNSDHVHIGNPHIDTEFDLQGNPVKILSRFNVLVQGCADDTMVWWKDWQYHDTRLVNQLYHDLNGFPYVGKSIPGNSMEQRWETLGTPDATKKNLLLPSAFVRTDCAHTVTVSPGPRLIITVALEKSIEEIINGP